MPSNAEIVRVVQDFCTKNIYEKRSQEIGFWDEYKQSWRNETRDASGKELVEEKLSKFTAGRIQLEVQKAFGTKDITVEKNVIDGSALAFDFWNQSERTAFEISLGAIKNEFEKDILKGILNTDTVGLFILYREYRSSDTIYGRKWFEQPASKAIMDRARILKLNVQPRPLVPDR